MPIKFEDVTDQSNNTRYNRTLRAIVTDEDGRITGIYEQSSDESLQDHVQSLSGFCYNFFTDIDDIQFDYLILGLFRNLDQLNKVLSKPQEST